MPILSNLRNGLLGGGRQWYRAGGAPQPVAAYRAVGVASLAASYVNLANPGTNNAAPGVAPTWAAADGWTFVAASAQYLTTNIAVNVISTVIVRFSGAVSGAIVLGARTSVSNGIWIKPIGAGVVNYISGAQLDAAPDISAGVLAIAGKAAYRNGAADGTIGAGTVSSTVPLIIGGLMSGATPGSYFTGNIQAVAIYSSVLTAAQMAAVSAAMASL